MQWRRERGALRIEDERRSRFGAAMAESSSTTAAAAIVDPVLSNAHFIMRALSSGVYFLLLATFARRAFRLRVLFSVFLGVLL